MGTADRVGAGNDAEDSGSTRHQHSVRPKGRLVAVHAHPDDEVLWTGGLLATWAAAGEPVTVVTCTRGERGEVIAPAGEAGAALAALEGDGPALAAHRMTELATSLAALGVRDHAFLDGADGRYEDSGMSWLAPGISGAAASVPTGAFVVASVAEAASKLAALLVDRDPAVVVTYEPGGGYGHPDHIRAHEVTVAALALLPGPGPELWEIVIPDDAARAARAALASSPRVADLLAREPRLALPAVDAPYPAAVRPASELDGAVVVELAPVLAQVLTAMGAHATQIQHATAADGEGVVGWYALSNGVLAPLPSQEFYRASEVATRHARWTVPASK